MIRIWFVILTFVLSLFRLLALGIYSVVVPEATVNLISNPSFETGTTGYTDWLGATTARSGAIPVRRGAYALQVQPHATNAGSGIYYTVSLSAATTYTWSLDLYATPGLAYTLQVTDNAGASLYVTGITAGTGYGRHEFTFTNASSGTRRLYLQQNIAGGGPFYTDGWQLEVKTNYSTTYCDGDQPGCLWNGTRHASTSSRSAQSRAGGRVRDLEDLKIYLDDHGGGGMPPISNITSDYGLLPGSTYQRSKVLARLLTLTVDQDDSQAADAFQALHDVRRQLIGLFDPFGVEGSQPTIVRYTGGSQDLELDVFYDAGLEGGNTIGFSEVAPLRLLAPNPFWRQVGNSAKSLSVNETIADADYIVQRSKDGLWQALQGGLSDLVYTAVYGPDANLYVGGGFVTAYNAAGTASPLTVNYVAKWDGAVWSALGSGFNNAVYALAFDAAGNLYAGGAFTDASYPYFAKWNGSAWSAVGTSGNDRVNSIAIGTNGDIYIGGNFTTWAGVANTSRIAKWNGAAWTALGTGVNGNVNALAVAASGNVYVGGAFTTAGGATAEHIAVWYPSNSTYAPSGTSIWQEVAGGIDNNSVLAVALGPDNTLYVGGSFTLTANHPQYIARRVGNVWHPLGSNNALNGTVGEIVPTYEGDILVSGSFTTVQGLTYPDRIAQWRPQLGWASLWVDLPGSPNAEAIAVYPDGPINPDTNQPRTGRIALGFNTSGTATSSNISDTTVANGGSAPVAPIIQITGPAVLETFVNMTTGRRIDFNGQTLQAGEVATLDLQPGRLSFTTTTGRNLLNTILSSHPTSFRLLRGNNTILVKLSGTTGASGISVQWQALEWSYDV